MSEQEPLSPDALAAWAAAEPPEDFATRVLAALPAERARPARVLAWRAPSAAFGALALAAGAMLALRTYDESSSGALVASARTEVKLGRRGVAVAEAGAEISWTNGHVSQKSGKVLYRVEPGAEFVVSSPEAEVHVLGTVFAVSIAGAASEEDPAMNAINKKSVVAGISGAALAALATVAVYEGRVRVAHAGQHIEAGAGESVQTTRDGVRLAESDDDGAKAAATLTAAQSKTATAAQVAAAVQTYKEQLEALESQRKSLSDALKASEDKLAEAETGKPARTRPEFDLDADDWRALAKEGTVKYRTPCATPGGWRPDAEHLNKLGLAPSDADTIQDAYKRTQESVWATLKPLCMRSIGLSSEMADRIGSQNCVHLVTDIEAAKLKEGEAEKGMRLVGEIMAGDKPEPTAADKPNPATTAFLTMARANKVLEGELAKSYGPEEAHRLAFDSAMCGGQSTFKSRQSKK